MMMGIGMPSIHNSAPLSISVLLVGCCPANNDEEPERFRQTELKCVRPSVP